MGPTTPPTWTAASTAQAVDERLVKPLAPFESNGWNLKVYGIAREEHDVGADLEAAGREVARETLPHPANGDGRHGVGFLILHDGAVGRWALVYWWTHQILLCERLFHSEVGAPVQLRPVTDGLIACVYELQVVEWERRSWLRTLASHPADLDAYLADTVREQPAIGATVN